MRKFTADFETTTDLNDCRVWAWGLCEIGNINNFQYGNNLEDFINILQGRENYEIYFHNMKFDSEYIFNYLLKNGYECIKDKKDRRDKTFTTLINDMGQFFQVEIYFKVNKKKVNKVTIRDSLKILNFSVEQIAKDFNLPILKGEIDYHKFRPVGYILDDNEVSYLRNDVEIIARALEIMFKEGLTKMTIGSDALSNYKEMNKNFLKYFPILSYELTMQIKESYKGGFSYLSDIYKGKEVGKGFVLDINSLYSSVLKYERMPIGCPLFFEGEYKEDKLYNLYIQKLSCSFELKDGMLPTLQIKNSFSFLPNEYLKSSDGDIVTITLTSVDLELFKKHYNISNITYHSGWKFKSLRGLFNNYIDKWTEVKINSKKEGNKAMYLISKLMLNSLYGKFGSNPNVRGKYPVLTENGSIAYKFYPYEIKESVYMPLASFVTSYARLKTISTSQKIRDYTKEKYGKDLYIYSDTDSIHAWGFNPHELDDIIEIDDYKLGAWKLESEFVRGKYLRQKCYIELGEDDKLNVTVAGLPKKLGKYINFDNFKEGMSILANEDDKEHKLTYKHVNGGVVLVDTDFTIK